MTEPHQPREDYVSHWARSLSILHAGHWRAARFYDAINLVVGLGATVCAAVSGTTAFQGLVTQGPNAMAEPSVQFWVGGFAVFAAALAALQTFFRSSELAVVPLGADHDKETRRHAITLPRGCMQMSLGSATIWRN